MNLNQPIWLWLLIPWGWVLIQVLRGYHPRVVVPFLNLWPRALSGEDQRRRWRPPPLPILLLLLASLLAIVAMAGPHRPPTRPRMFHLAILMDRGLTMAADQRLDRAAQELFDQLAPLLSPEAEIELVESDGTRQLTSPRNLLSAMLSRPATAADQRSALRTTLARMLRESPAKPLIVVSDDRTLADEHRVLLWSPPPVENVGIAAAGHDNTEVFVELLNQSSQSRVKLDIRSPDSVRTHWLDLPPSGSRRQYVLKAPAGQPIQLRLHVADALAEDNTWSLTSLALPPRIELAPDIPESVARVARAYSKSRPPTDLSPTLRVTSIHTNASRSIYVAEPSVETQLAADVLPAHSLLRNVELPQSIRLTREPLPRGNWQIVLQAREFPALAADESTRRVWIGFDSKPWEKTPGFAIFWTNVFEYLADTTPQASTNVAAPFFDPPVPRPAADQLARLVETQSAIRFSQHLWLSSAGLTTLALVELFRRA